MIEYSKTERGDILKIVAPGAPGFAALGDLVRVLERTTNGVKVENKHGEAIEFYYNCGAERLEPTEWKNDFPVVEEPTSDSAGEFVDQGTEATGTGASDDEAADDCAPDSGNDSPESQEA